MLLLACAQIFRRHVHDAVGVDVEGYLNLRHAAHCRRNAVQTELAEGLVVLRKLSLTLQYVDIHRRLVIGVGGEHLAVLGRDGRISLNQSGRNAACRLDGK